MKTNKKSKKIEDDESSWHTNERSKRPKKPKNETIDLIENINQIENSIEEKKVEDNSAKESQLVKENLEITNIENNLIKNEIKMEPLQVIVPKEDYYKITKFDIFFDLYYFDYIGDNDKELKNELRDFDTIRWIYSVNDFVIREKNSEDLRKKIVNAWLKLYKEKHINHDFTDLLERSIKIKKKEEQNVIPMLSNEASLNSNKLFKQVFEKLVSNTKDVFLKHKIKSNLNYTDLKFSNNDYKLKINYDAYCKKEGLNDKYKKDLQNSENLIYHPKLISMIHKHAFAHNKKELSKKADNLIATYYPDKTKELYKQIAIVNGSSDDKEFSYKYQNYNKVISFSDKDSLTNLDKVKSYSEEVLLLGIEGYIKYIHDDDKSSYVIMSFGELDEIIGETNRIKFMEEVRKNKDVDIQTHNKTVEYN